MITESSIYWITRLDSIRGFLGLSMVGLGMGALFLGGAYAILRVEYEKKHMLLARCGIWFLVAAFLLGVLLVFIPSTKEMCAIKIMPSLTRNQNVQGLGEKALILANEWLDEQFGKKSENVSKKTLHDD